MGIQGSVPSSVITTSSDPLNSGNLDYDPFVTQTGNTGGGLTGLLAYFYSDGATTGHYETTQPTTDQKVTVDSTDYVLVCDYEAGSDTENDSMDVQEVEFLFYADGGSDATFKIEWVYNGSVIHTAETSMGPSVDYFDEVDFKGLLLSKLHFKIYAKVSGLSTDVYIQGHTYSVYWKLTKGQYFTVKSLTLKNDIKGRYLKTLSMLFDIQRTIYNKTLTLKNDISATSLGEDTTYHFYVNGTEVAKSMIAGVQVTDTAYTPEARKKPHKVIMFTTPNDYALGSTVKVTATTREYQGTIVRKSKTLDGTRYTYEAYLPYSKRKEFYETFKSTIKNKDTNYFINDAEDLFEVKNADLLTLNDSEVLLLPQGFTNYETNVNAPDKVCGFWKPNKEAWYEHNELTEALFDATNGSQQISNLKYDNTEGTGVSIGIKDFPSFTLSFEKALAKKIYADAIGYISVRFTSSTGLSKWENNSDFLHIRLEGEDKDGKFRYGDIVAQAPYSQGRVMPIYGWNNQPWDVMGGYLGNGLNNSFQTNDRMLDWWVTKIIVILYPVRGTVTIDGIFITGSGTAKNCTGSGTNVQTVDLESTNYDDAITELAADYSQLQTQKGYQFMIPLRLSLAAPFYFKYNGETLKVYSVQHDLTNFTTKMYVGTGFPAITTQGGIV